MITEARGGFPSHSQESMERDSTIQCTGRSRGQEDSFGNDFRAPSEGTVSGQAAVNLTRKPIKSTLKAADFHSMIWFGCKRGLRRRAPINFNLTGKGSFSEPNLELLLEGPRIVVEEHVLENVSLQGKKPGRDSRVPLPASLPGKSFLLRDSSDWLILSGSMPHRS